MSKADKRLIEGNGSGARSLESWLCKLIACPLGPNECLWLSSMCIMSIVFCLWLMASKHRRELLQIDPKHKWPAELGNKWLSRPTTFALIELQGVHEADDNYISLSEVKRSEVLKVALRVSSESSERAS